MFLSCNDDDRMNIVDVSLFESNPSSDWGLLKFNLPNYPKNVEEMKIARYLFRQIFKCFFRNATLDSVIRALVYSTQK
ncbi:unnamed protein product [Meloidogyne enterolobii]|uniref:Uncharacterized protein n=1 Tax=Meloidogyne enterolobii TaxID=390850 RepID=A0ACB0ZCC4_MELEN